MKNGITGLLILMLCVIASFAQDGWTTFTGDYYSIDYPSDWILNDGGTMGTTFVLVSPMQNESDDFRDNVNFVVQDLAGYDLDLKQFAELSEKQVKELVTDSKILNSEFQSRNDKEMHHLSYTGKQGVFNMKLLQYFWVNGDKAYLLTFTGEESEFENYQDIFEKIFNSFTFSFE